MNARFLHPAGHGSTPRDEQPRSRPRSAAGIGQACCCPAWPVIQVIMPATARRPHQTELLLCAHHYRVSRHALDLADAVIFVLPGCPDDALLCDAAPEPAPEPAFG